MIDMTGKSCLAAECHGDLAARKFVHPPVMQGDCNLCHALAAEASAEPGPTLHRFQTSSPTLELCGKCHSDLTAPFKVVHAPLRESCTACHDPHGGEVRYFIAGNSIPELCFRCHKEVLEKKPFLHAPTAFRACEACHTPHASNSKGLLGRPPEILCFYCHVDWKLAADHALSIHAPAGRACFECHNPHGGESPDFLPATQADLCRQCHAGLFERMEKARYSHEAMVDHKACSDCHDPHWAGSTMLLKRPSMQICLDCHMDPVQTPGGSQLQAVGQVIAQSAFLHGPIGQQDCTPCHATHGSDDPRLMKASFPPGFYAPFSLAAYALCFGCHDPNILREDRPLATGFRNGDENLHYFHVCRDPGRSCRACHHEHASNMPYHLRDWVTFGKWKMDILFQPAPTGGTCVTGCHSQRGYDRLAPVDNAKLAAAGFASPPPSAEIALRRRGWTHLLPGATAPDFALPTMGGETSVTLRALAGQRLLVFVRPDQRFTTETLALCRRLFRLLPTIRGRLAPVLVWVGSESTSEIVALSAGLGPPWRILRDPAEEAGRAYRVVVSPTLFLIDSNDQIAHVFPAWHPRLETNLLVALARDLRLAPSTTAYKTTDELTTGGRALLYFRLARELDREGSHDLARALSEQIRLLAKEKRVAGAEWERWLEGVFGLRSGLSEAAKAGGTTGSASSATSPTLRSPPQKTSPTAGRREPATQDDFGRRDPAPSDVRLNR